MIRIAGYAIVSADGMIANPDGTMPEQLIIEADQRFFRNSLARAQVVVHGRNSGEGGPDADQRNRVILTSRLRSLVRVRSDPAVLRWNPAYNPFDDVLRALEITTGTIAVIGGPRVFDLFLNIGYDAFYLSRASNTFLQTGRPLFAQAPDLDPGKMLQRHGLTKQRTQLLAKELILESWER